MASESQDKYKCLNGQEVSAKTVMAARLSAKQFGTKLLMDTTKQESDQYQHRFGALVR